MEPFLGGLAYSRVEEITRVATPESEEEWIAFSRKVSQKKLVLEVKDAKAKGRSRPRSGTYGLPAVRMKLPFDFSPEDYELVTKVLRKLSRESRAPSGERRSMRRPRSSSSRRGSSRRSPRRPSRAGSRRRTRSTRSSTIAVPTAGGTTS